MYIYLTEVVYNTIICFYFFVDFSIAKPNQELIFCTHFAMWTILGHFFKFILPKYYWHKLRRFAPRAGHDILSANWERRKRGQQVGHSRKCISKWIQSSSFHQARHWKCLETRFDGLYFGASKWATIKQTHLNKNLVEFVRIICMELCDCSHIQPDKFILKRLFFGKNLKDNICSVME